MKHRNCGGDIVQLPSGLHECDSCKTKGTHLNEYTDGTSIDYSQISEADRKIHDQVDESIKNSPSRIPKRIRIKLPDGTYRDD